jgi:hypothetical protein
VAIRDSPVTLAQLNQLLDSVGAHPLSTAYPVWELARPRFPFSRRARRFSEVQARILDAIRALPWAPFLRTAEAPRDRGLIGAWQLAARETWLLPADESSPDLLEKFLSLGDWTLYLAVDPVPPTSLPDCFQSTPLELSNFVESHGIPVLVEAHLDNNPWRLVVEPAAVPGVVAA